MLFMGNKRSAVTVRQRKKTLNELYTMLSGLQQPDHSSSEKEAKEAATWREEAERELDITFKEFLMDLIKDFTPDRDK